MDNLVIGNTMRAAVSSGSGHRFGDSEPAVRIPYKRLFALQQADMLPDTFSGRGMTRSLLTESLMRMEEEQSHDPSLIKALQWHSLLINRDRVNTTPVNACSHLLGLTPTIQIALIKPRYWRPALIREAYLLERCKVDPAKVWRKMDDHTYREEITHSLNLLLALRRQGIHHEGFESAMSAWQRKHK